ncbi:MAG: hypothetical protein FE040_02385 [Thermoplasmata archaeon]|nr:MAG: hypothetical protein FE040_02385 [Thermoplasmata archaeon]RLF45664.1 MAG: hypothetical protein DRN17_02075 [Thermoplasmata archaeon]RLF47951.1 MAG: hypothetical protein DRN10_03245 [Thermoplasmata archaeon]
MSKPIGVRIDERQEDVWKTFKDFVEEKYGKKHTVLGNELIKALQIYLELNTKSERSNIDKIETQFVTQRAGDLEIKSIKENSYDILNTLMAVKGYIDNLEYMYFDKGEPIPLKERDQINKIKQRLSHAQKLLQERIESIG